MTDERIERARWELIQNALESNQEGESNLNEEVSRRILCDLVADAQRESLSKLQRVRDWLKHEANSPGGIVAEIDAVLAAAAPATPEKLLAQHEATRCVQCHELECACGAEAAGGERDQADDDEQADIRFLFGDAAEPEPRTAPGASDELTSHHAQQMLDAMSPDAGEKVAIVSSDRLERLLVHYARLSLAPGAVALQPPARREP